MVFDEDPPRHTDLDKRLQAAQRMESIGVLASGLAHDFNNALTVMLGQAHILQATCDDTDARRLESIITSGRRAAALAWQLLDIAHSNRDQREPLLLVPLLKESIKLLSVSFAPRIQFNIVTGEGQLTAEISPTEFHQIAFNLCINAAQAMESGEVEVELQKVSQGGSDWALLTVADTGGGIPDDQLKTVFQPFYTTKQDGTGLGLTMVRTIAQSCGGRIELQSETGKGTTARVWLPAVKSRMEFSDPKYSRLRGQNQTIVFLDDDPAVREALGAILSINGYVPEGFETPEQLEEYLEKSSDSVGVLMLDVVLPQISGTALCAQLSTQYPDIPIILMSACRKPPAVEAALHFGQANAFVSKPFDVPELLHTLHSALMKVQKSSL